LSASSTAAEGLCHFPFIFLSVLWDHTPPNGCVADKFPDFLLPSSVLRQISSNWLFNW
jgi:hypothetical protein